MSRALLSSAILAICLAASPAHAAPVLLVQFAYDTGDFNIGPLPTEVPFGFWAEEGIGPTNYVGWVEEYTVNDVGMSFFAPPEMLTGGTAALMSPSAEYWLGNGGNLSTEGRLIDLPSGTGFCNGYACTTVFVPDVSQYVVTAMERTIDKLVLTLIVPDRYYGLEAAHTIRLYGERVPEPSAVALVWLALVIKNCVR